MVRAIWCAGAAMLALGLAGCPSPGGEGLGATAAVKGQVTLDGAPMASGEIGFAPPGQPLQFATITNGAYSGQALVGENRVEVFLYEDTTDPSTQMPMRVNKVPARFNTESTLKATVAAGGANEFNFDVQSQ